MVLSTVVPKRIFRRIRGSGGSTGKTFTDTLPLTDLSYGNPMIHVISTTTSRPRCAWSLPQTHCRADIYTTKPLAPANGAAADATRDPLLRDKVHGNEILEVRKALAFAGFTHKSPRVVSYVRADKAFDPEPDTYGQGDEPPRGRSTIRASNREVGKGRPISM